MKRLPLFALVVVLVCACYRGYQEWLLHHSYNLRLTKAHLSEALFYSEASIDRNRRRVRCWIQREFEDAEYLDELHDVRQMIFLLSDFDENADLEFLWECAQGGFRVRPSQQQDADLRRRQQQLSDWLVLGIFSFYDGKRGGPGALKQDVDTRVIAPEVKERFDHWFDALEQEQRVSGNRTQALED